MSSIGERLRQERLQRGLTLDQIAEITKINTNLLEAIEADDLERLPGIFFTRSFVRQYAKALALDDADFEQDLDQMAGCEQVPTLEGQPSTQEVVVEPVKPAKGAAFRAIRALAGLILTIVVLWAASTLWQRSREAAPSAPAPRPAPAQAQQQEPPATQTPVAQTETPAPAAEETPAAETPQPTEPPAVLTTVPPGEAAPLKVEIRATQPTWIRVVADGKFLFSGVLEPNQTRTVEGSRLVQLMAGNAGGVELTWNGKPVGPIGPEGQVRRLEFTPEEFRTVAPPKPATPSEETPPAEAPKPEN